MATKDDDAIDDAPSTNITTARYERAITEDIPIDRTAELSYEVEGSDETYFVDLDSGHCTCQDAFFRGVGCKHANRCALHSIFTDDRQPLFVSKVMQMATREGCVFDNEGCNGPVRRGEHIPQIGYPCSECVRATGHDDWTVWCEFRQ